MTPSMAAKQTFRRTISVSDDHDTSDESSTKEEEKTIPFLRRLVDMLKENENVISFVPGCVKNGKKTLGRIVVHDRTQMEANLPRYFNHSSFASLRRQLNYFCFTRLGKGRQRGATYCNEAVMELDDILKLKRRSPDGTPSPPAHVTSTSTHTPAVTSSTLSAKHNRSISISSSESEDDEEEHCRPAAKKMRSDSMDYPRAIKVSLMSSLSNSRRSSVSSISSQPCIVLDLTVTTNSPTRMSRQQDGCYLAQPSECSPPFSSVVPMMDSSGEEDVLEGCRALLSFSRSTTTELVM